MRTKVKKFVSLEYFHEFLSDRANYHREMMMMFQKLHGKRCWGYRGHEKGYEVAKGFITDIENGKVPSNVTVSRYLGAGYRIEVKEGE